MPSDGMLVPYSSSISPSSLPECTAASSFGGNVVVGVLAFTVRSCAGDSRGGVRSLLVLYRNIMLGQCPYYITSVVMGYREGYNRSFLQPHHQPGVSLSLASSTTTMTIV